MANSKNNRSRRRSPRDRRPQYVAPVLDPTWQNPYAPSPSERATNVAALRVALRKRSLPAVVACAVLGAAACALPGVGLVVGPLLLALAVGVFLFFSRRLWRAESDATRIGHDLVARFQPGGSSRDRARLNTIVERLAATFGLDDVSCFVVNDPVANAALLRSEGAYVLLVTDTLLDTFELIELEGVVAHLMARERLGLLDRRTLAVTAPGLSDEARRSLAGNGLAYRADEVAAAAIRYPLGLSGALARSLAGPVPAQSYFATPAFQRERWVWFNPHVDGQALEDFDVDHPLVRSRALAEW